MCDTSRRAGKHAFPGKADVEQNAEHTEFLKLFTKAEPILRRHVLAHIPSYHEAEDVLQDIAVTLWDRFGDFRRDGSFTGWAMGVARRKILHSRRSFARDRLMLTDDINAVFERRLEESADELGARRKFLRNCMAKLSEKQRNIVNLKYRDDLSTEKIAANIGSSANAVRIVLTRTRHELAQCMQMLGRSNNALIQTP